MKLYIRNMACESCKLLVKEELEKLGLGPVRVEVGVAEIKTKISEQQQKQFISRITEAGLELVKSKDDILVDLIKAAIAEYIEHSGRLTTNLSGYLSKKLHYDYAYLSTHFSAMQNNTVEQYMINLKIEKVKEMLTLYDLTLTQIAYKLNYSSVAHLSHQFKKVTGVAATEFKKRQNISRKTIQEL